MNTISKLIDEGICLLEVIVIYIIYDNQRASRFLSELKINFWFIRKYAIKDFEKNKIHYLILMISISLSEQTYNIDYILILMI